MKIKYFIINPGGNITAIVPGKFSKKIKLKITKTILRNNSSVEQVGFWTSEKKYDAKLEMAGGEFCGNALRCLGSLLSYYKNKKNFIIKSPSLKTPVKLSSSVKFSSITLKLSQFKYQNNTCSIPGIKHILSQRKNSKKGAKKMLRENNLLKNEASGVISYEEIENKKYKVKPIVYVRDTKTLFEETSCASGTLALAYMLYKNKGIRKLHIKQPSGFILKTSITENEIILSGSIVYIKEKIITI